MIPFTDYDLESACAEAYKKEYSRYNQMYLQAHDPARDKQYAAGLIFLMLSIGGGLMMASPLSKEILAYHAHAYKLGASKAHIVRHLPEIIAAYKQQKAEYQKKHKPRLGLSWKYSKTFLPAITINLPKNNPHFLGSVFESHNGLLSLAKELGNFLALEDFLQYLKNVIRSDQQATDIELVLKRRIPKQYQQLVVLSDHLEKKDLKQFFAVLQSHFASFSYQMKTAESFFQSHVYAILRMIGMDIIAEDNTNQGRIDCSIETEKFIYIFEFKEDSVQRALQQIQHKEYYQKFLQSHKQIILVGVAFSNKKKNIIDWKELSYPFN